jgi:hypothetical protein
VGVVRHTHSYPHAALACVKLRVETEETQANVAARDSVRLRLKCDDTRAETRFGHSAKRTSPLKSAGTSV